MLPDHAWVKETSIKVQDRSLDFNVMEYKKNFLCNFRFHIATSLKTCHLSSLGIVSKNSIYNYLKMLLIYKNVFHILQPKPYIETDNAEADMTTQFFVFCFFFFIKPDIKETCENIKQAHASQVSFVLETLVIFYFKKYYLCGHLIEFTIVIGN